MGSVREFEDLIVWQLARDLARQVYRVSKKSPFNRDFGLRDQVCSAAVSVAANIAEGFGRGGNKEFVSFLSIARGSVCEVRALLLCAADQGYLPASDLAELINLTKVVASGLTNLMGYLRESALAGPKFRRQSRSPPD